jgi:carbonic anhydrase
MVLGHKGCGAIKATLEALAKNEEGEGHLGYIVNAIQPAVDQAMLQAGEVLDNAVRANIRRTVNLLKQVEPFASEMAGDRKLKIVGAYYDLESGMVELL